MPNRSKAYDSAKSQCLPICIQSNKNILKKETHIFVHRYGNGYNRTRTYDKSVNSRLLSLLIYIPLFDTNLKHTNYACQIVLYPTITVVVIQFDFHNYFKIKYSGMILDSICPARLMSRTPCQNHKRGYEFVVDIPNLLFSTATISLRPVGLMANPHNYYSS